MGLAAPLALGLAVVFVTCGVGCGGQASPSPGRTVNYEPLPRGQAQPQAAMLQKRVRRSLPVPYDANVEVAFPAKTAHGLPVRESTTAPLVYTSGAGAHKDYFRLTHGSLHTLRVQPISRVVGIRPIRLEALHPHVRAVSDKGIVRVSHITHEPYVTIRLSNGEHRGVTVAQTSAVGGS